MTRVTQSVPWVACALGSGPVKAKEAEPAWDRTVLRAHGRQTRLCSTCHDPAVGHTAVRPLCLCAPEPGSHTVPPAPPRSGQAPVHRAQGRLRVSHVAALAM